MMQVHPSQFLACEKHPIDVYIIIIIITIHQMKHFTQCCQMIVHIFKTYLEKKPIKLISKTP